MCGGGFVPARPVQGLRDDAPNRLALAGEQAEGMEDGSRVVFDAVGPVCGVEEAAEGEEQVQIVSDLVTAPKGTLLFTADVWRISEIIDSWSLGLFTWVMRYA